MKTARVFARVLCPIAASTAALLLPSPGLRAQDQERVKRELLEVFEMYDAIFDEQYKEISKHGDVFQAALEIYREEEKAGRYNGGVGSYMLKLLGNIKDPRARDVFMPYLTMDNHEDYRWHRAIRYVILSGDREGETWIRTFLETSENIHAKSSLLTLLGHFGDVERWIDYLKQLRLNHEEESGLPYRLQEEVRVLERRRAASRVIEPPKSGSAASGTEKPSQEPRGAAPAATDTLSSPSVAPQPIGAAPSAESADSRPWMAVGAVALAAVTLAAVIILGKRQGAGRRTSR